MRNWIVVAAVKVAHRVLDALEALFPEPDDDLMAVAEAAGVVAKDNELAVYHRDMCEAAEANAEARRAMHEIDFTEWGNELTERTDR